MGDLGGRLDDAAKDFDGVRDELDEFVKALPNPPDDSVPPGREETDNVELRRWKEPSGFNFEPRDHVSLASASLDLQAAARISGSRFSVLRGSLARLHRGLIQFMIDTHVRDHGYEEVYVPYLVDRHALVGTGQLPKFEDDLFAIEGDRDQFLIPTAEVPVTNLIRDSILKAEELPLRFVAHTPCFRSEAGNYGKDTHGIFRQHQFEKVELVQIVHPDRSWDALEELTAHAETILRTLELPYRAVALCAGDLGFAAAKTIDLEVWLPAEGKVPRDILLQQLPRLPGSADAGPVPEYPDRPSGLRAHPQRIGVGRWSRPDRCIGELPRRQRCGPRPGCIA